MGLPADLLLLSSSKASRLIALQRLDEMAAALERLREPEDADALHDFRVALRRLRSTLRTWREELGSSVRPKQLRALAAMQEATGAGRDAEVGSAWLETQSLTLTPSQRKGCAWLLQRLQALRAQSIGTAHADLAATFTPLYRRLSDRLVRLRIEVNLKQPLTPPTCGGRLAELLEAHLQSLQQRLRLVSSSDCHEQAHAARIRLKRLRYLLEPAQGLLAQARPALEHCKTLQDLLGEFNDLHVLRASLTQALEEAAVAHAREWSDRVQAGEVGPARGSRLRAGLSELLRRASARCDELFARLASEWLESDALELRDEVAALAAAARLAARPHLEIERKYLLRGRPDLPEGARTRHIDQGWLPGERIAERIRRVRDGQQTSYMRALKFGRGIERTEIEEPLGAELFSGLWPLTRGRRVAKLRHDVPEGELVWEVDEFLDRTLWLAEVELPERDSAVEPPGWLAPFIVREVTDEPGFTNLELALAAAPARKRGSGRSRTRR